MEYKKIYFGGAFPFKYKEYSEDKLAGDYRAIILGGTKPLLKSPSAEFKFKRIKGKDNVFYAGPYYFYEEGTTARNIVKNELQMVEDCTDAVFLLENTPCPGTITEVIHSSMIGKKVHIFYVKMPIDKGEPENEIENQQWYSICFSQLVNSDNVTLQKCEDREEAITKILTFIGSL